MDYRVLHEELKDDPVALGYADMDDAATADVLNDTTRRQVLQPISTLGIIRWAARNDALRKLEASAVGTSLVAPLAKAALEFIRNPSVNALDLQDPEVGGMFDMLVQGGVFTTDEKADLVRLATVNVSRATELGLEPVKPGDVGLARGGVW